jgi:PhoPQ-activated pathogenicity-related protein
MRHAFRYLLTLLVTAAALPVFAADGPVPENTARETGNPTPLDTYVAKPDPAYRFEKISEFRGDGWTGHVLHMTSQRWRSEAEVDRTLWEHWVSIVVPDKVKSKTGILYIGGGRNGSKPPKGGSAILRKVALATNTICASVLMVPNQPLSFTDEDGRKRSEDATIAYTWDKYLRTGDAEWLLRLPMTKSAVRAMDTVQTFCARKEGGRHAIEDFIVLGGSKRGWTTWTTTAVDKRVKACIPIVIDLLNLVPSFVHHWKVYGFWAPAINDYVHMDIMSWMGSEEYGRMLSIVDPYSYRDRLTMPKLLVNAAGDQFFLPTSWQFYLDELKGKTLITYVPNVGHGSGGPDGIESIISFCHHIVTDTPLPAYSWEFPNENTIIVKTASGPAQVRLWQATNPDARDFRVDGAGGEWTATELEAVSGGTYAGRVEKPEKGWTAFLVQIAFKGPGAELLRVSSPVKVIPDIEPFDWEWPETPAGGFLENKK